MTERSEETPQPIGPWPKIWAVRGQVAGSNVAFFNLAAAERFIAERAQPDKFVIFEYEPAKHAPGVAPPAQPGTKAIDIARVFHNKMHWPETKRSFYECSWWPCSEFRGQKPAVAAAPAPESQPEKCRNPNHALVDGSLSPHDIGASCMAGRVETEGLRAHSFEDTVQPAMNALSLESLRDMQVKIAERIRELDSEAGSRASAEPTELTEQWLGRKYPNLQAHVAELVRQRLVYRGVAEICEAYAAAVRAGKPQLRENEVHIHSGRAIFWSASCKCVCRLVAGRMASCEREGGQWVTERCKLYPEFEHFANDMGFILAHSRVLNTLESELKTLRSTLRTINSALRTHYIVSMGKRLGGIPGKTAPLEEKIRYNDTVTRIKSMSARFHKRIYNLGRP